MNIGTSSCALALLTTTLAAQSRELVVDRTSGPYTEIQSAVDAARPGDKILVAPGSYAGFTVKIGVSILAKDASCGPVQATDLPADHVLSLRGLSLTTPISIVPPLRLADCKGHVVLDACTSPSYQDTDNELRVTSCADVRLENCSFFQSWIIEKSTVAMSTCYSKPRFITGRRTWTGIAAKDSRITIARSILAGGTHFVFKSGLPAIMSDNSEIYVYGTSFLSAGGDKDGQTTTASVDVITGTGEVVYSPDAVFYPTLAGKNFVGVRAERRLAPQLEASAAVLGQKHELVLHDRAGNLAIVLLGAPRIPQARPVFGGYVEHRSQVPVFVWKLQSDSQSATLDVPQDRGLLGYALAWQALSGDAQGKFTLSNSTTRIVSDR